MLDHNLVLKSDELFLAGDVTATAENDGAKGLYARDTRFLSRFSLRFGDKPLDTLAVRVTGPAAATVTAGNQDIPTPEGDVFPLTVTIEQHVTLAADLRVRIRLRNFTEGVVRAPLAVTWAADFRDLFDIRGFSGAERGIERPPAAAESGVTLGYTGLDGSDVSTVITYDQPAILTISPPITAIGDEHAIVLPGLDAARDRPRPDAPGIAVATFGIELPAGGEWETTVVVTPHPAGAPISALATVPGGGTAELARVSTDHAMFNAFLARSKSDLAMLQTSFAGGSLPAAGIPWYVAPFGRDSLIVGLQTVHLAPRRAEGTLRVLAALQGTKDDPWRGEEPGKILHEIRYGEMARRGEIPHTPYYGTADATPLWLMLFAEVVAWTGDDALYRTLLPHAERALAWIAGPGDPDQDGFVEYEAHEPDGIHIVHQVWKDSFDSLHHRDGSPVLGSIAAVEVQGYVFAAYTRLADVAERHGDTGWAASLRAKAEQIRTRVEEHFWLEDEGYYAQALDTEKRPVAAISSNPGHLLFCGLPSAERAARLAARLAAPDLDSGWGIRTLSTSMPSYNPMSYHNGSVWPHDNSLIAAGLARYGHRAAAARILESLFDVAKTDPLRRLPELYCGFEREDRADVPVAYPVSCSPQAWAAAAAPLLVESLLGMRLDLARDCLLIDPALPAWIDEATVHGLEVRGHAASFSIRRVGPEYEILSSGPVVREPR